jgi:tripartite-type tricarboxylate transporter receptor subunit TctC
MLSSIAKLAGEDMPMKKVLGALVALQCLCGAAAAQTYPDRPVTMIVAAAAGGVTDIVARALGQELGKAWGQPVVIENRGGAANILGTQAAAKATPDGYTLLAVEAGAFTINPTLYKGKLPYDPEKDFAPISGLVRINQALLAKKSLPVASVRDLIALAKSKPGQLTYGTAGIGTAPHMNMALFESMAGVKLQPVHYRGATPAIDDVIGGHIDLMIIAVSSALPSYRAGQLKILGIGSEKRLPQLPDIPTVAESGLPGYQASTWFGLFAPAGTPPDIVTKLNREVQRIFADQAFRARFLDPQMYQAMTGSPDEFADYIKAEQAKWSKVIGEVHIKVE